MKENIYVSGFNAGYRLKKEAPNILSTMLEGMEKESTYKMGLRDGGKQYDKERIEERIRTGLYKKVSRDSKDRGG
jgi:hypothetical protein